MKHLKVSGNHARLVRLDPDGNPVGEPVEIDGFTTFDIGADSIEDTTIDLSTGTITMDFTLQEVDPELLALLFGEPVQVHKNPSVWRLVWSWLMHWIKDWYEVITTNGMTEEERREFHKGGGL